MRVLFWQAAAEGPTYVDAQSVALGVGTITADPTVALYVTSTAQAVATISSEPTVAKYQVSTLEGVATVTTSDPTVARFLDSVALGEATVAATGEAYTEPVARVISGGMVGIPRNPPWDWHRKPKKEDEEDEQELVAAGVEKSGIDPLLVMILAMDDD